jgi:hypothetical protein
VVTIRNIGNQTEELIFSCDGGYLHKYLNAGGSVTVPSSFVTDLVRNLATRRILSIVKVGN